MTNHSIPAAVAPDTEPVLPAEIRSGDKVMHPFEQKMVTVTVVYLDSLDWRGDGYVEAAEVWWHQDGRAGIIKHAGGDDHLQRLIRASADEASPA